MMTGTREDADALTTDNEHWLPRGGAFWGGQWRNTPVTLRILDPEDNSLVGVVADVNPTEVEQAVAGLARELDNGDWPLWQRREALERAADLLRARGAEMSRLISLESSKTVRESRAELKRAVETMSLTARSSAVMTGEVLGLEDSERGAGRFGWFTRAPIGVVALLSAFNDPLNLLVHKLAPALLGGNTVAIKPSEYTPLTALFLTEVLLEAGVPPLRMATLPGEADTGRALVEHPTVRLVSFTGGPATGEQITREAGAKVTLMELGGNCAVIVCSDADVEAAAKAVCDGSFGVAGQNCISVQRVLVACELHDAFLHKLVTEVDRLVVGTKSSEATDVGPLINEDAALRVESWVDRALQSGATLHTGGRRDRTYYSPTVLGEVPVDADVWSKEIFGPVVCVNAVETDFEAVAAANATEYGLQAGVFTRDIDRAFAIAHQLTVGAVMINDSSDYRLDSMPFGGPKGSSIGREGIRDSILAMTQPKVVAVRAGAGAAALAGA